MNLKLGKLRDTAAKICIESATLGIFELTATRRCSSVWLTEVQRIIASEILATAHILRRKFPRRSLFIGTPRDSSRHSWTHDVDDGVGWFEAQRDEQLASSDVVLATSQWKHDAPDDVVATQTVHVADGQLEDAFQQVLVRHLHVRTATITARV